ncbi:histidine kinase [Nonomuraea sp. NPDC000554]|uniref:sensor histidine kinase n=1 Tax=Nonomuraea sp. NPDC000554 TaxID=3154259 RepID=UPI00332AE27F
MKSGATLLVIAGLALLNGLSLDGIPMWRQFAFVALAVAAYLHGRHLSGRRGWLLLSAAAVPGAVHTVLDFWDGAGALTALGLFVTLPWLAGRFRRQQAELLEAGRERVARLEREQEYLAERATLRERARIASDMHDLLGHDLALIALRAGALELAADLTGPNREAAAQLRASAVEATDRLRRTITMLRESGPAPTRPPEESIQALVERARAAGMTIDLRQAGERAALPPLVDRAAHRVVQESLTNAARYAPGADVLVHLEQIGGTLTITVTDSAPTPPTQVPKPVGVPVGNGSGIAGLRERVRLLGGTLQAGPRDGGFTVTARLPLDQEGGGR